MGESVLVELPLLNTQPVCLFTMKYVLLASGVTTAAFRPNAEHKRQSNKSVCFTRWDRFVLLINDKYEMVCLMTEGMSCIMQLDVTTYLLIISSLAAKIRMFFRTVART